MLRKSTRACSSSGAEWNSLLEVSSFKLSTPKFGVHLPNSGGAAVSPDSLVDYQTICEIAIQSEKLGFDSVWANEHLTLPHDEMPVETKFFEPITLLSSIAALTSRIILGTAIVILPFRDPFIIAKESFTLSEICSNRFVLGVGPGRFEREYSAQSKNWAERNKILEEQIRLIRELALGNVVNFAGKNYSSKDLSMRPVPKKMPIILGGSGPTAVKRALKLCDGIMPGHVTLAQAQEIDRTVNAYIDKGGREFTFYNEILLSIDKNREKARSKFDSNSYVRKISYATDLSAKALIGNPSDVLSRIRQYVDAGVQEFVLIFADETEANFIDSMELFSSEVMPNLKAP